MVIAAGQNFQGSVCHTVDQAKFPVDAAGPEAGQVAFEGFGFACAFKRMAQAFFDERVDFAVDSLVGVLPVKIMLP